MNDWGNIMRDKAVQFAKQCVGVDPLDGDDTLLIAKMVLIELNLVNGNITNKEYERAYKRLEADNADLS